MRGVWIAATAAVVLGSTAVVAQEDRGGRERPSRGEAAGGVRRAAKQEPRHAERSHMERRVERPAVRERAAEDRGRPKGLAAERRDAHERRVVERRQQVRERQVEERRDAQARRSAERRHDAEERRAADHKANEKDRTAVERKREAEDRKTAEHRQGALRDNEARKMTRDERALREHRGDRVDRREERADSRQEQRQHVQLSDRQRTQVRDILTRRQVRLVRNADFAISVGVRAPRHVRLYPIPVSVIEVVPEYRRYSYFIADDSICIVDPATYEIVYVVDRREPRHEVAGLELSSYEREFVIKHVAWESARADIDLRLALGVDIPRRVELYAFPDVVLAELPKLRRYRYVVVERDVVICDPDRREIALVIQG